MKLKPIVIFLLITFAAIPMEAQTPVTPNVSSEASKPGYFPLSDADIYTDSKDYHVVGITANMLTTISTCCQVFQPSALYVHPYLQVKWSKDLHIEV